MRLRSVHHLLAMAVIAVAIAVTAPNAHASASSRIGHDDGDLQARIINGTETTASAWEARWPWMAAVLATSGNSSSLCGGVVIDSRTVLTAAHCTSTSGGGLLSPSSMDVVVGRRVTSSGSGDRIDVQSITRHPSFDPRSLRNDISVLRLARAPVVAYAALQPTSAADESWWGAGNGLAVGSDLVGPWIAGWGATRPSGGGLPDTLHEAKVPIASDPACRSPLAPGHGSNADTTTMLCAGVPSSTPGGGVDTCQGDSGGPLIVGNGSGQWRLVGLTSWGLDCGGAYYGVYTRVGRFVDWIEPLRFEPSPAPPAPTSPPAPDPTPAPAPEPAPAPAPSGGDAQGAPDPAGSTVGPVAVDAPVANRRPTMPTRLRAWRPRRGVVVLTWRPSRDDVRVVGYRVLVYTRRGWRVQATTHRSRVRLARLRSGRRYIFRVQAVDDRRLRSRASAVVRVRAR